MKKRTAFYENRKRFIAGAMAASFVVLGAASGLNIVNAAEEGTKFPARFDLREQGVVTPVKQQSPFGTCWAFGETAAAETSILSSLGETYESYPIDLSEKHLAWFSLHPVTAQEDPTQAGEGLYPLNVDDPYNTGGLSIYATSLYASGCGPVTEKVFPYRGAQGITEYNWLLNNKEEWLRQNQERLYSDFLKNMPGAGEDAFLQYCESRYSRSLENYSVYDFYSDKDDWTIQNMPNGDSARLITSGFVLKNGNILPEYQLNDGAGNWTGTNPDAVSAIKQELLNGRAVSIAYCADVSMPNEEGNGTYMNYDNYAQYVYDAGEFPNHEVAIVGWDDNYSRKNFNKGHQPPANGAWIVKNSWGSQTDAAPGEVGYKDWGVVNQEGLHTGYFYLSYYDRTICLPESMEFSQNMAIASDGAFSVYGYDYMAATQGFKLSNKKVLKTANVFTIDQNEILKSVSAKTASANARVKFEIYVLNENASSPEDGERLASFSENFNYAGYHRIDLDKELKLKKGQKISVVVTEYTIAQDGSREYTVTANAAYGQAKIIETMMQTGEEETCYAVGIINPGESYFCEDGQWADWSDVSQTFKTDGLELDNFSIKAYVVQAK